jgi:hypothetical protein
VPGPQVIVYFNCGAGSCDVQPIESELIGSDCSRFPAPNRFIDEPTHILAMHEYAVTGSPRLLNAASTSP